MTCLPFQLVPSQALLGHQAPRLVQRPTAHQRFGLRKAIGDQQFVVMPQIGFVPFCRHHEFTRDHPRALMDQLVKRMLPVGPGFAPDNRAGVDRQIASVHRHGLTVALHLQLLEIGGQPGKAVVIWQNRARCMAQPLIVPNANQRQQNGHILVQLCGLEMTVHRLPAAQECFEAVSAQRNHQRKANRPPHRIAPANPILKAKNTLRRNTPFRRRFGVGRQRDEAPVGRHAIILQPRPRCARVGHGLNGGECL